MAAHKLALKMRPALVDAIRKGVPLWNAGDFAGCTRVYRGVCAQYAAADPRLAAAVAQSLDAPVDASATSAGWLLRRAMDAVLQPAAVKKNTARPYGGAGSSGGGYISSMQRNCVSVMRVAPVSTRPLRWHVLNDVVMGGRSTSRVAATTDGSLDFRGAISLVGGGFASCRTLIEGASPLGIPRSAKALKIVVTGDGQMYKLCLRRSDAFREPTWQAQFLTVARTRTTAVLELSRDFFGSIMGRPAAVGRTPDWTAMRGIGLSLSLVDVHGRPAARETFHDGPFAITLHSIEIV